VWWSSIPDGAETQQRLMTIYESIRQGANAFLFAEYKICAVFIVIFGALILVLTSFEGAGSWNWDRGLFTCIAFVVGGCTSIISGYLGMSVAVFSNARTTVAAINTDEQRAWTGAFNTAFRGGAVMGFFLTSLALLVAYALVTLYSIKYPITGTDTVRLLFECFSGYGLGGSSIAMFGRVGGGIYTKAADVGADLAGKVVEDIPEDDPRNPATIADNVGDNVGDVAGMGSDLFGSFAEGTCAALVVAASSKELSASWASLMFPLLISAVGIVVCIITSFFATDFFPCRKEGDVENVLKVQLGVSALLMTAALYPLAYGFLPETFNTGFCDGKDFGVLAGSCYQGTPVRAFGCVCVGLWSGCIIGFVTEYYTSASYEPTREVARSCTTGAATNVIYGLALGYESNIIPITLIAISLLVSFSLCGIYGVSLAALGMLATLATCLTIDVYGPICDNAGGIAEMAMCPSSVRDKTDALDAAGNTTAAIGKGFAIGSAALVAVALFGRCFQLP
jgi:inorganic pyrophosphatase